MGRCQDYPKAVPTKKYKWLPLISLLKKTTIATTCRWLFFHLVFFCKESWNNSILLSECNQWCWSNIGIIWWVLWQYKKTKQLSLKCNSFFFLLPDVIPSLIIELVIMYHQHMLLFSMITSTKKSGRCQDKAESFWFWQATTHMKIIKIYESLRLSTKETSRPHV